MKLLVGTKLIDCGTGELASDNIVVAMRAHPMPTQIENIVSHTQAFVRSVLAATFCVKPQDVHRAHTELVQLLETLGGMGKATMAEREQHPGLVSAGLPGYTDFLHYGYEWCMNGIPMQNILTDMYITNIAVEFLHDHYGSDVDGVIFDMLYRSYEERIREDGIRDLSIMRGERDDSGVQRIYYFRKHPLAYSGRLDVAQNFQLGLSGCCDQWTMSDSVRWLPTPEQVTNVRRDIDMARYPYI